MGSGPLRLVCNGWVREVKIIIKINELINITSKIFFSLYIHHCLHADDGRLLSHLCNVSYDAKPEFPWRMHFAGGKATKTC